MPCTLTNCSRDSSDFFETNTDVSGLGVLIGFLATAWATFFILVFYYLCASEPSPNPLDVRLRQSIQSIFHWNPMGKWDQPLKTVVLAMSDQQLVTGIAIMISGYYQLHCSLSLYHWQIITNLTWFSSITHLATLPFLQQYLQQHKYIFYLRLFFMFGLAMMLAVALPPVGNAIQFGEFYTPDTLMTPAKCFMRSNIHAEYGYTIISEIILLSALCVRLVRMFPVSKNTFTRLLRLLRDTWLKAIVYSFTKSQKSPRWVKLLITPPLVFSLVYLVLAHAAIDLVRSGSFELLWLIFSLIWGTIRIFSVRGSLPEPAQQHEEDVWGFGQLVPVILLLIPVLLIAESWSETASTVHSPTTHTSPTQSRLLPQSQSQSHISLQLYPPPGSPTRMGSSSSLSTSTNDTFYTRIISLCGKDFRCESWYEDTLYFMLSSLTAASPMVFPLARDATIVISSEILLMFVVMLLVGGNISHTTIPLCGIIDSLEQHGTQRHGLSIVRILTSAERRYRRIRYGFYICFPISMAISMAIAAPVLIIDPQTSEMIVPYFMWLSPLALGFLAACFVAFHYIWSEILHGK